MGQLPDVIPAHRPSDGLNESTHFDGTRQAWSFGDRLVPPEESEALFTKAGEPKKLVTLRGFGHYEVYVEPAFSEVMTETKAWFQKYLPHT